MSSSVKRGCLILALAATAVLGLASESFAGRLSTSNRNFRLVFREMILGSASGINNTCELTLEGSFHSSTIAKVERTLIGYITRVDTAHCTTNTTILRTNLPWHLTYESFTGTLPNITSRTWLVRNIELLIEVLGFRCLIGGSVMRFRATRNTSTGAVSGVSVSESVPARSGGGFGCPDSSITLTGSSTYTVLGTTTPITITLI